MENNPVVSVIMGCYNNENTILAAIESILEQDFTDFEFIIIDDCSTDRTVEIIKSIHDERIILFENVENKGLGYSLNLGIQLSKGRYIARMDADDITLSKRFQEQITFLKKHKNTICLGTGAKKIGNVSILTQLLSPNIVPYSSHERIKASLLLGTPMLHPSVMINGELLRKSELNYDPAFRKAQDYEFWSRMVWLGEMRNIKKPLMKYRYSESQSSSKDRSSQIEYSKTMYNRMLFRILSRELTSCEMDKHILFATKSKLTHVEFQRVQSWIEYLYPFIINCTDYNSKYVIDIFSHRFAVVCRDSFGFTERFKRYFEDTHYGLYQNAIYLLR